jgi:hypothetical protein
MALEKKMVIMPTISKVRNFGWDGSGLHCHSEKELAERFLHQSIDETVSFEFTGEDWKYFNNNRKIYVRENISKEPWPILIIRLIYNILKFNFCGF